MRKLISLFLVGLLVIPYFTIANASGEPKEKVVVYDSFGNKIMEKMMSASDVEKMEKDLQNGKIDPQLLHLLPRKRMDFGFLTYVISYGRGKVYIPLHRDRSFLRFFLRPIFFKYERGITIAKFGANYVWDRCKTVGDYGFMIRRQRGVMVGFIGLHIKISHKLDPDTHIFIGGSMLMIGNDLFL